jgi:hypothetical protein
MTDVRFDFMSIPCESERVIDGAVRRAPETRENPMWQAFQAVRRAPDATHERSIQSHFFVPIALGQ